MLAAKGKRKRYFGTTGRAYAVTLITRILKNHLVAPLATTARGGLCLATVTRTVPTSIHILHHGYNPRGQTEGKMTTSLITPLTTGYRLLGAFLFEFVQQATPVHSELHSTVIILHRKSGDSTRAASSETIDTAK